MAFITNANLILELANSFLHLFPANLFCNF